MLRVFGLLAVICLSGCASLPPTCLPPAQTMATVEMYFRRKIDDRVGVCDAAFADFSANEITSRFLQGLTVVDARGQWRESERGRILREPSKVALITFTDSLAARASLTAIADAYKQQFRQQSVLTTVRATCATF